MKVTLKDIAKAANVSTATVSLVLNDKPIRITDDKREEILRLAQEMKYIPNHSAQMLATKKSKTIGLIVPDLENIFFASYVKKFQTEMLTAGYFVLVANSNDSIESDFQLIKLLVSRGIDALVIATSIHAFQRQEEYESLLNSLTVPFIMIDRTFENYRCNSIHFNNDQGMYLATRYLIDQGHKHIDFLNGDMNIKRTKSRFSGFKRAMRENNLKEFNVYAGDYSFESGYDLFPEIINKKPTAIVVANDMMALGVMKRANEMNVSIPEDLSIVGFDNLLVSELLNTPLTTVDQDNDEFVTNTKDLLLSLLKDKSVKKTIILEPKLVVRDSINKLPLL